jgi:ABC-type phosphate transport system permease subunit
VAEIKEMLNNKFVTSEAFQPVKALVYGMAGIIMTSVVVALVALVVKR